MGSLLAHEDRLKRFNQKPLTFQVKLKFSNGEKNNGHNKNYKKEKHHIIIAWGRKF